MIPYNHDDKLNIYVHLKIISTIITQHFFTFITQHNFFTFITQHFFTFITQHIFTFITQHFLKLTVTGHNFDFYNLKFRSFILKYILR